MTMMMSPRNNKFIAFCGKDCTCYVAHKNSSCKKEYRRLQRRIEKRNWRKEYNA